MFIKMRSGTIVEGEIWEEGKTYDASIPLARQLIHAGQAVAVDALPPAPPLTTAREEIEHGDPQGEARDPQPKPSRTRK